MKKLIQGKDINDSNLGQCIDYYGRRFWPPNAKSAVKVNGEFMARRYNQVLDIIVQTKATVKLTPEFILIEHENGSMKIGRDLLVDQFLKPAIAEKFGFAETEK